MNAYMNAAVATERQQQLIADAHRRSRANRAVKAIQRRTRNPRPSFASAPRFAA